MMPSTHSFDFGWGLRARAEYAIGQKSAAPLFLPAIKKPYSYNLIPTQPIQGTKEVLREPVP